MNEEVQQQQHWLLKTEPEELSWKDQEANSGLSVWDGVRNPQAQKMMKSMSMGDLCLFYHTGKLKQVEGIVRVVKTFYPDPTDESGKWGAVDVHEVQAFRRPVTLAEMKDDEQPFKDFTMLRQPRLSVVPVDEKVWERVCELGEEENRNPGSSHESREVRKKNGGSGKRKQELDVATRKGKLGRTAKQTPSKEDEKPSSGKKARKELETKEGLGVDNTKKRSNVMGAPSNKDGKPSFAKKARKEPERKEGLGVDNTKKRSNVKAKPLASETQADDEQQYAPAKGRKSSKSIGAESGTEDGVRKDGGGWKRAGRQVTAGAASSRPKQQRGRQAKKQPSDEAAPSDSRTKQARKSKPS